MWHLIWKWERSNLRFKAAWLTPNNNTRQAADLGSLATILILHGNCLVCQKKIIMYMKVVRGSRREGLSFPLILQVALEILFSPYKGLMSTQFRSWTRLREGVILGGGKEIMGSKCSNLKLLLKVGISDTQRQQSRCHQKNYHCVWRFLQQGGSP